MKAIILTAGKAERLKPVIKYGEKILLPISGQPIGIRIMLQYIEHGIKDFIIVTSGENRTIIEETFNSFFFNSKIKITYHTQMSSNGPGEAVKECIEYIDEPVIIHLADTMCKLNGIEMGNWIGVSPVSKDFDQWCMVAINGDMEVTHLYDKPIQDPKTNLAAIGIYCFEDYKLLNRALLECVSAPELSTIFKKFMKYKSIKVLKYESWQDLGNMPNYIKNIRYGTADCRYFNKLTISDYGSCIKRSSHLKTVNCEKDWYRQIKNFPEIKRLVPQIYNYFEDGYEMEFFDYPSLSFMFLYYNVRSENWKWIVGQLLKVLKNSLWRYKAPAEILNKSYDMAYQIYAIKLKKRLRLWGSECLHFDKIIINGNVYKGLSFYKEILRKKIEFLSKTAHNYMSTIHGDLVFSNILYSTKYGFFKLIDARGNFGENTIFGDMRYDYAKLRQCYHGLYDLIVNDSFELHRDKNVFEFNLFSNKKMEYIQIDALVMDQGINIDEIEWIECLLFLSMIPLHNDKPNRQLAFYLIAIILLSELYTG